MHLNQIGTTFSSSVELIYHIGHGQLFALKLFYGSECEKL